MKDNKQQNLISLLFLINGKRTLVEKVNVNQPLQVSVQKALEESGNIGRPLEDWQVRYNDNPLNLASKVNEFNFTEGAVLHLSLKSGEGGGK